ncbi:hypothetical protein ACFVU3_05140 [Streptomyces sp. NPDC058052]|uniref:hypothetical protein n=1 Tax=Streptomyces sp. NPDC058052 TaxID=3346316 RepID=UPI0036EA3650
MATALRIEGFIPADRPVSTPTTKFGGRPVWLTGPQWPVSEAWDRPMRFVGQFALDPVLGPAGQGRLAYVFVTHADHGETFFDPDVIDPDGGENAVIVQPGGTYAGPVRPLTTGPTLYDADGAEAEFTVALRPVPDPTPPGAEPVDADKIGGTPAYFQGDDRPDGDAWRLLLQLDANWTPFSLLLGSAPRLFAFVSRDGTRGRLLVQDS